MNSKKINNSNSNLSRKEINQYRETRDERERFSIEQKSMGNDFDMDALEGWSEAGDGTNLMSKLDRKFIKKISFKFITFSLSIFLISGLAFYIFYPTSQTTSSDKSNLIPYISKKKSERTDLIIPSEIIKMTELPDKHQINIKTIQKDLISQRKEDNYAESKKENNLNIDPLPINSVNKIDIQLNTFKNQEIGKEIYLHDVKLLDYRVYRSKPQIKSKQIILNGTPASQESQSSNMNEINEWKIVDIPYIEYIDKTISVFAKGNNKKALTRLEQILVTYPDDLNANFYSGICYYNLNEFNKAITAFEKCLSSQFNNFNEEAEWYLAKSLQANNNDEKAKILFEKIKNSTSYYSNQVK